MLAADGRLVRARPKSGSFGPGLGGLTGGLTLDGISLTVGEKSRRQA